MPPRDIRSQVRATSCVQTLSPVRAACRSRNSKTMDGGNFGAVPNPPRSASKPAASPAAAASSNAGVMPPGAGRAESASSWRTMSRPWACTSARRWAQTSDTRVSNWENCTRGKYVPQKNGWPSGVRKHVIGQPPDPVMACVTSMYTASTSGRSSRSTFTLTKPALSCAAMPASSKDSWAMTWHQWQAA